MIGPDIYNCDLRCGHIAKRAIGESYTSPLSSHTRVCANGSQSQQLGAFGITGGNLSRLTPVMVREYFALWTAENARPFSIVNDTHV